MAIVYQSVLGSGGGVTPTNITPSDSSPAAMAQDGVYKALANGYAIESNPASVTPSSSGAAFSAGINKMTSSGYAYSERPSGTTYAEKYSDLTSNTSKTITGLTVGKHYLVLVYMVLATNMTYNRFDGCTASGGTLTKVSNMGTTSTHGVGTFYDLVPSASSVTITAPNNAYCKVFND